MVATFGVIGAFSHFLRSSHTVIAPEIVRDLGLSAEGLGVMTSAFFLAYAASQIPTGVLLDRFGSRRVMSMMLLIAVAGNLVFGAAGSLSQATLGRLLMGVGCASLYMGAYVACARWVAPARFGNVVAVITGIGNGGNLIAATPMAVAATVFGWREIFFALGALTLALALVLLVVVRDAPPAATVEDRPRESLKATLSDLHWLLANREMHCLVAMALACYATFASVFSLWVSPYLHDVHGLGAIDRGNVVFAMALASAIGAFLWAAADRVFNTRKGLVIAGATTTIGVLIVMAVLPRPSVGTAAALLTLFCLTSTYSVRVMIHGRMLFPDHMAGRAMTTVNLGMVLGVALVLPLTGVIVGAFQGVETAAPEAAYRAVFVFLAVLTAAALAIYGRITDVKPR